MKSVPQLSRPNSNPDEDSRNDLTDDGGKTYQNFKNNSEDIRDQESPSLSDRDPNTVANFINPAFQPNDEHTYDRPKVNYDSLAFHKSKDDLRQPSKDDIQQPSPATRRSPQPPKARTDITKPPEEIEMGMSNHGYHANEKARSDSWGNSLAFSPYAVDTPIGGPADGGRMNSLLIPAKRDSGSSKHSDYSYMSADTENPYAAPSEVISAYDHIPGQEQKGRLPPPRVGTKKANLTYESAVIKHQVQTKSVKTDHSKEAYEEDEHSNRCHSIFIMLVGIIALIALVMSFLIIFGTISVKKCKECDMVEVPTTGANTGGNTGGNNDEALLLVIERLRNNLTSLHQMVNKLQNPQNQTTKIVFLENELTDQKLQVASLSDELAKQKNATNTLNQTSKTLRTSISHTESKMAEMNVTQQIEYMFTTLSLENVRAGLTKNLTQMRESVAEIHSNMTRDLEVVEASLRNDLVAKISTSNFTKLINDAQGVVDELYGMINTSNSKRKELNETIHVVDRSLSNQMEVLLNASTALEQNMTLYGKMLSKLKKTSTSLDDCKFQGNGRYKDIAAGGQATAKLIVKANSPKNTRVISASCDATADNVILRKKDGEYSCECTGVKTADSSITCYIHALYCPM